MLPHGTCVLTRQLTDCFKLATAVVPAYNTTRVVDREGIMATPRSISTLAALALGASGVCFAQDPPPWLYIGAGAGQATLREDQPLSTVIGTLSFNLHQHDTGWRAFVGVRPISLLGAELEYASFGESSASRIFVPTPEFVPYTDHAGARAVSAFALGYLPLPSRWLDVYAKAGIADLRTHDLYQAPGSCPPGVFCAPGLPIVSGGYTYSSRSEADFAYGAGLRLRFGALSLSADYERISARYGDPDLLSLNVSWWLF